MTAADEAAQPQSRKSAITATADYPALCVPKARLLEVSDFARRYGWTPNRASRIWEDPGIQGYAREVVPVAAATLGGAPEPFGQRKALAG